LAATPRFFQSSTASCCALPVRDLGRLVLVNDGAAAESTAWNYAVWEEIHGRQGLFENSAAWWFTQFNEASAGETHLLDGLSVSGTFFGTLGVPVALGRGLVDTDDRRSGGSDGPVTVISFELWRREFDGDVNVLGRALALNNVPFTVVGVTPEYFLGRNQAVGSTRLYQSVTSRS
jgi:hypothetical protein